MIKHGKHRNESYAKRLTRYSFESPFWEKDFLRQLKSKLKFPKEYRPYFDDKGEYQLIEYQHDSIYIKVIFNDHYLENIIMHGCCGRYTGTMLSVLRYLGRVGVGA